MRLERPKSFDEQPKARPQAWKEEGEVRNTQTQGGIIKNNDNEKQEKFKKHICIFFNKHYLLHSQWDTTDF